MRRKSGILSIAALIGTAAVLTLVAPLAAQASELSIGISKDSGYSSGGQIQGRFTLWATGPADLTSVTFQLDGQTIGTVTEPPFKIGIDTGQYSLGHHTLSATGHTSGGSTLTSQSIGVEMVSTEGAMQGTLRVILPLFAVIGVVVVLATVLPYLLGGRRVTRLEPGAPRQYGPAGGAICRNCGRPFSRHFFSPNLMARKLERCPYCGTWSLARRASPQELAAAEAAEIQGSKPSVPEPSAEESLRRQIEESRYQ